jgi:hypothetical protein
MFSVISFSIAITGTTGLGKLFRCPKENCVHRVGIQPGFGGHGVSAPFLKNQTNISFKVLEKIK